MEALLNLPTHDASNFAKYKQSSNDNQQLALHKQEACGPPKYQPPTIFSNTSEPEVVGNERRNILLREFYALGLQRDGDLQPQKSADPVQQQQQRQQPRRDPPPASPKRHSQHHEDDRQRTKQPRLSTT